MPDGYITDRNHLALTIQRIIGNALDLQDAWLNEDSAACFPRTSSGPRVTGGTRTSATETIATGHDPDDPDETPNRPPVDDTKYRDRDRIGNQLRRIDRELQEAIARTRPRHANGPCRCCKVETATHGVTDDATPALCWPCHRYLQHHGYRCTDDVHQDRPRVRWCDCPPSCCDPCPDHAAEGRTLSDRCRQRKARRLWDQTNDRE